MIGAEYRILHAGEKIRISSGKSIYADGGGARIKYVEANASDTSSGTLRSGITAI